MQSVSSEIIEAIEIVGSVLPFKTNNYVVDNLIDWDMVPDDPMFKLTFPQKEMLLGDDYAKMKSVVDSGAVSYTHLRAHETVLDIVCRLLLEKKKNQKKKKEVMTLIQ